MITPQFPILQAETFEMHSYRNRSNMKDGLNCSEARCILWTYHGMLQCAHNGLENDKFNVLTVTSSEHQPVQKDKKLSIMGTVPFATFFLRIFANQSPSSLFDILPCP